MAQLIAVGTAGATSADFTVVAGTPQSLLLKDGTNARIPKGASALIQYKTSEGVYMIVDNLSSDTPLKVISAPGTYRVVTAGGYSLGVDKN